MSQSHTTSECFFCEGDGTVIAQPGDVRMTCPFCKGSGQGASSFEEFERHRSDEKEVAK